MRNETGDGMVIREKEDAIRVVRKFTAEITTPDPDDGGTMLTESEVLFVNNLDHWSDMCVILQDRATGLDLVTATIDYRSLKGYVIKLVRKVGTYGRRQAGWIDTTKPLTGKDFMLKLRAAAASSRESIRAEQEKTKRAEELEREFERRIGFPKFGPGYRVFVDGALDSPDVKFRVSLYGSLTTEEVKALLAVLNRTKNNPENG